MEQHLFFVVVVFFNKK